MSYSGKLSRHDETSIMLDEVREPTIVCEWGKRKKCDSFYIEMYNKQKKKIQKAIECINYYAIENEDYNKIYSDEEKELLEILGDSNE